MGPLPQVTHAGRIIIDERDERTPARGFRRAQPETSRRPRWRLARLPGRRRRTARPARPWAWRLGVELGRGRSGPGSEAARARAGPSRAREIVAPDRRLVARRLRRRP